MTPEANKALIRRVFEKVIPAGVPAGLRELVAPDLIDHDPLPGQPAGLEGAEYVVSTMHGAHPDLRFTSTTWSRRTTGSRSAGRCTAPTPAPCSASRRPASRSSSPPIVIFRIADGKIAERWAGWKPGRAPSP